MIVMAKMTPECVACLLQVDCRESARRRRQSSSDICIYAAKGRLAATNLIMLCWESWSDCVNTTTTNMAAGLRDLRCQSASLAGSLDYVTYPRYQLALIRIPFDFLLAGTTHIALSG